MLRAITRLNIGGPALQAAILTERLDPARFQTTLVAGGLGPAEGSMLTTGRLGALRPEYLPRLRREISPLDDARALAAMIAIARRTRPHVVHTHLAKAGMVGRVAGRLAGARVIVHTYHGSVFRGYFGARESRLYLAIERMLARISTRVIAITQLQRDELVSLRLAPVEKIVVIPLGLDLDQFRTIPGRGPARVALGLAPDVATIVIAARLVPIKDVATFLRAFGRVASGRDVQCAVVGDGEERGRLEAFAAELGLGARCRFLGWQNDMRVVYAAADVVALSSLNEGSPVTLIEAMAAARPVVATAVGGVPDVVTEDVGVLVPARADGALAEALVRILDDPAAAGQLGAAGRERAFDRFSADRLVRDVERLYDELLGAT